MGVALGLVVSAPALAGLFAWPPFPRFSRSVCAVSRFPPFSLPPFWTALGARELLPLSKFLRRGLGRGVGLGSVDGCFPPSTPPFWGRFGIPALDCRDFPRVPFLRFALGRRVGWCWRVGSRPRLGFLPLAPVAHLHIFEGLRRCSFRQVGTSWVRSFRTWRTFLAT